MGTPNWTARGWFIWGWQCSNSRRFKGDQNMFQPTFFRWVQSSFAWWFHCFCSFRNGTRIWIPYFFPEGVDTRSGFGPDLPAKYVSVQTDNVFVQQILINGNAEIFCRRMFWWYISATNINVKQPPWKSISLAKPWVFLWVFDGFWWSSHHLPMVFLWFSHGFPVALRPPGGTPEQRPSRRPRVDIWPPPRRTRRCAFGRR